MNTGEDPGNDGEIGDIGSPVDSSKFESVIVTEYEKGITISNDTYKITYNTESGLSAYDWYGERVATGIYSSVQLDQPLTNKDYSEHIFSRSSVEKIKDEHGKGIKVTVWNKQAGRPEMKQIYQIYDSKPYFVTSLELHSNNRIGLARTIWPPLGGIDIGSYTDNRFSIDVYFIQRA
jgi:alpha-galactosidase